MYTNKHKHKKTHTYTKKTHRYIQTHTNKHIEREIERHRERKMYTCGQKRGSVFLFFFSLCEIRFSFTRTPSCGCIGNDSILSPFKYFLIMSQGTFFFFALRPPPRSRLSLLFSPLSFGRLRRMLSFSEVFPCNLYFCSVEFVAGLRVTVCRQCWYVYPLLSA